MAQSPYHESFYPPLDDVDTHAVDLEDEIRNKRQFLAVGQDTKLIEKGAQKLVDHTKFLEGKLRNKVCPHPQSSKVSHEKVTDAVHLNIEERTGRNKAGER